MNYSTTAGDLNAKAVALLSGGNYDGAEVAFNGALGSLRFSTVESQILPARRQPKLLSMDSDENDEGRRLIQSVPLTSICPCPEAEENLFEFYPRLLVMLCDGNPFAEHVVILYNIAVANHSKATHYVGHYRTCFLQKALRYYNTAQEVLYNSWSDIADDDILLVLSLVLSNNVGHCHYWLNNFRDSQNSLHALQHFMGSLPEDYDDYNDDDEDDQNLPRSLSREDYNFFNKTVVIFEGARFTTAPAA